MVPSRHPRLLEILRRFDAAGEFLLFGSQARGDAGDQSDVDLLCFSVDEYETGGAIATGIASEYGVEVQYLELRSMVQSHRSYLKDVC